MEYKCSCVSIHMQKNSLPIELVWGNKLFSKIFLDAKIVWVVETFPCVRQGHIDGLVQDCSNSMQWSYGSLALSCQYSPNHCCWWPGNLRSQGIISNGINLVLPEDSCFSTGMVDKRVYQNYAKQICSLAVRYQIKVIKYTCKYCN